MSYFFDKNNSHLYTIVTMQNEAMLKDILEIVTYLKDNSVKRDEFLDFKKEVATEFKTVREDVISHVDHFIGLHTKLDTELTALRTKYDRLEEKLERVMQHLQLEKS